MQINFRHLKVLLSKRFAHFKYDYRQQWLTLIDNLSSTAVPLPLPERAIMALAHIIESPSGMLFVQENDYSVYVPAASWPPDETPGVQWQEWSRDALMSHMERTAWIVDTDEPMPDGISPRFLTHLTEHLRLSAFVVPLLLQDRLFGLMVLKKGVSGYSLTYEDIDLLRTSGRQVASYLAQHYVTQRLAEAQQFESYGRMTAFLIHDLKNIIAQQKLLVQNAARHRRNPQFIDDAVATIEASVERMGRTLRQLKIGNEDQHRPADLAQIVSDAVDRCRVFAPAPELEVQPASFVATADSERLTFGLTNIIRNAQQAASPTGSVRVSLRAENGTAIIDVVDDGPGMSDSFVNKRLFRPFDTTSPGIGMGIGAFQLREALRAIGGTLSVTTAKSRGSRFTVRIPLADSGPQ